MSKRPVIVTGCGRSGTHWLGNIMHRVFGFPGAAWEPDNPTEIKTVVVDSRIRHKAVKMADQGYRVVHLVRDGREVVRSLDQWHRTHGWMRRNYGDGKWMTSFDADVPPFEDFCLEWADAVDTLAGQPTVRLEDLSSSKAKDEQTAYAIPHWREWDDAMTTTFWELCGEQMAKMGYKPDE